MPLSFGTGGLRGVMDEGPEGFNDAVVERTTLGLGAYLLSVDRQTTRDAGVVIAYDTRKRSGHFAALVARTLASMRIPVACFAEPTPTPVLSFAVLHMQCVAGIVITASHNPKEYNGYKVYNRQGYQLTPAETDALAEFLSREHALSTARTSCVRTVDPSVKEAFLAAVSTQSVLPAAVDRGRLSIVYTPLHGTGQGYIPQLLKGLGYTTSGVAQQETLDGAFPTVQYPNPEDREALSMAIEVARERHADLVLATDPDCDRVGAAVLHDGDYQVITGNQMGALLMQYLLQCKPNIPSNAAVIKTIVTNDLGAELARQAGITVLETLTGFKYVGEKIAQFAREGSHSFLLGYEESCGYLVGEHTRDKDAFVASMLICEMAAYHQSAGKTLMDALEEIYQAIGYYLDALDDMTIEDQAQAEQGMQKLRDVRFCPLEGVAQVLDYGDGIEGLPPSDVLKFVLDDGAWVAVRPSGTEPKVKVYYGVIAETRKGAEARLESLRAQMRQYMHFAGQ